MTGIQLKQANLKLNIARPKVVKPIPNGQVGARVLKFVVEQRLDKDFV